jgi:azurin
MNRTTLHLLKPVALLVLLCGTGAVRAADCAFKVEGNDQLQYSARQLQIPASCTTVELTLTHSGKQPIKVIGHNWVLSKSSDVNLIVAAGQNAGLANNYQAPNDPRIIAATPVVGGGESTTIHFSTERLQPGGKYTFFCTYPGHAVLMKGTLVFGGSGEAAVAAAAGQRATVALAEGKR